MIKDAISRLGVYIEKVPLRFLELPKDIRLKKPPSGKWSKQEILGHLVDSALYNWQRMTLAPETEGTYTATGYPQAPLVNNNAYQELPAQKIIQLWKAMNQQIVAVCDRLTEDQLKKEVALSWGNHSKTDLAFLINDYVSHMEHHLEQIFGSLATLQQVEGWQISVAKAKESLAKQTGQRFVSLKQRGSLLVEYYAPIGSDPQQPHPQDELYVIISGSGYFYCDGARCAFKSGDVLFVPAGIDHRFEEFTEDFATWVIFYGPEGGELTDEPISNQ